MTPVTRNDLIAVLLLVGQHRIGPVTGPGTRWPLSPTATGCADAAGVRDADPDRDAGPDPLYGSAPFIHLGGFA
ncbi:hypothetical protein [Plantactinospora soyae]|uniref:Uncharacterized protein n=1 Tax=Plantactinospora soyae TaxID=1544732 RepID=A0A927QWF6_9ACTN|nr:hypothetical protein [Plantactinospora soyae]MBE1484393.1 hypothetical protein [Plantactinospora soyae]